MTYVFYTDMSHVWSHPTTGAKLFQGNREAAVKPSSETGAKSLAVVADNMVGNDKDLQAYQTGSKKRGYEKFRAAALRDVGSMIPSELEWTKEQANRLADLILEDLKRGRHALVCCWSGYNRSGLVAALVMTKAGVDAKTAIETLRVNRSPHCCNNDLFCRIIRGEA